MFFIVVERPILGPDAPFFGIFTYLFALRISSRVGKYAIDGAYGWE